MATTVFTAFTILWITVQSQRVSRTTNCSDSKECYNSTQAIRNTNVICNGQESCALSLITTPRARTGYIKCSGWRACWQSDILAVGRKDVYCSGFWGCQYFKSITAQNLYCTGWASCYSSLGETGISATNDIVCGGSQGCSDYSGSGSTKMTASGSIKCSGYLSCQRRQVTAGRHIRCSGSESCQYAILSTPTTVYCTGEKACRYATITAGTAVILSGTIVTKDTIIIDTPIIEAYGASSIGGDTQIDSGSLSAMTVRLIGSSTIPRDAFVICRSGAVCDLVCESTGCGNIVYQCEDGATCNVSPVGCSTNNSGGTLNGISCPTIRSSSATIQEIQKQDDKTLDMIEEENDNTDWMTCGGFESCAATTIVSEDRVKCGGAGACQDTNIVPLGRSYVLCEGESSCQNSVIRGRAVQIQCRGLNSCYGATLTSSFSLTGDYPIYCDGANSCKDAIISLSASDSIIEISGYLAATGATINIQGEQVLVTGYQGLAYGTIDSDGAMDLRITLNAAQAMYGGTVICRNGSICTVVCKGSSCENMDYLCETGATCNTQPSGCESGTVTAVNNNICPTITNVANTEIEGFLEKKKVDRENDEVYIEIQEYIFDVNKYDVDEVIINEELSFGEVGVVERVLTLKANQMMLFAMISVSVCIGLILSFRQMILKNKEYTEIE